jgi:intein/homing endonuclease
MIKTKKSQKIRKRKIYKCGGITTLIMKEKWKKHIGKPLLSRIVADITSDGHLQIQNWRGLVSFYSNKLEEVNNINKRFMSLFNIEGKIYTKRAKNIQYRIFFISKPLAIFLNKAGTPEGNKANQPFFVPGWIFNGNSKVKSAYLRGLFSGEGSIFPTRGKKTRWRIGIEMYKWEYYKKEGKRFMEQIKIMINNLGIKTSPVRFGRRNLRKDGTHSIAMKLDIESSQFSKFYKHIGFDSNDKTQKLLSVIAEAQK